MVVLANGWVNVPPRGLASLFWDIVDTYSEDSFDPAFVAAQRLWFRQSLSRVMASFVVSLPLLRKLSVEGGASVPMYYLPNGVDIEALRRVQDDQVELLRERWSLRGHWILGYIGNHDAHAGLDFLLEVFQKVQERMENVALLIVGPYVSWKGRLQVPRSAPVVFTGPLPRHEIPAYCKLQDVAVHPCDKSPFRDYAFPLKVIEATAARKFVLSTDLLSLAELRLPNLYLLDREVELWVRALESLRKRSWQSEWDHLVEPFEWERLAEQAANLMDQSVASGP
jgi:glycosyltransferase involved in cell wall biosynthesis